MQHGPTIGRGKASTSAYLWGAGLNFKLNEERSGSRGQKVLIIIK
jgi:hypothetical protein